MPPLMVHVSTNVSTNRMVWVHVQQQVSMGIEVKGIKFGSPLHLGSFVVPNVCVCVCKWFAK